MRETVSTRPSADVDATVAPPLVVKGVKSIWKPTLGSQLYSNGDAGNATVLATFGSDGSPAAIRRTVGKGSAYYIAFLPGLSYYDPAIPKRPVDRSSVDSGFNHFIPTAMEISARTLIAMPQQRRGSEGKRCAGRPADHP